jgi:hypothetical protein
MQDEPFSYGRQISESESEAQDSAKGESRYRNPAERAESRSRQSDAKKVARRNSFSAA